MTITRWLLSATVAGIFAAFSPGGTGAEPRIVDSRALFESVDLTHSVTQVTRTLLDHGVIPGRAGIVRVTGYVADCPQSWSVIIGTVGSNGRPVTRVTVRVQMLDPPSADPACSEAEIIRRVLDVAGQ